MRASIPQHRINDGVTNPVPAPIKNVLIADFDDTGKIIPRQYPHRHTYYEILLLHNSKGIHHIDFKTYPFDGAVTRLISPFLGRTPAAPLSSSAKFPSLHKCARQ